MIKSEDTFPWLTKRVEEKMKGLNWARQNNKPVWYEEEPMQIVLSLRPIDEEPPDYILETKDGEHLKVNLLNRKLFYYEKGTEKPTFEEEKDLLSEGNIDVSSSSKLSTRMQNHISSLTDTKKSKTKTQMKDTPIGADAQQLLSNIDVENERTEDLIAEINLYFQFFGSKMFDKVERAAISELSQIGIAAEPYDKQNDKSKRILRRKRKREDDDGVVYTPSAVVTQSPPPQVAPMKKKVKREVKKRPIVKSEKPQAIEMRPHIVKILNQELGAAQDFYLTFNCLRCHGIFTSVVQPGEYVEHLCTSVGNKKVRQQIRPKGKIAQVQALQVAVV